ncbi:MerR family transcriptional regulator [Conexibacter sp. SYSU D00693]|uniref:MerR family transcriptional regulator n=1 Tax=Conexibacter sp. SYSU D00693 TaxID=2812560 RepID=UPI00196B6A9C|nr:MerR family transcriptional regulator [Conexibacter sp. SYSU D00693]
MSAIRTTAAAAMLGVSPSTLRSWERRFGFPEPLRTAGGHRHFDLEQIEALRAALHQTGDAAAAIAVARSRGAGPATDARLGQAFAAFDEPAANRLLEESLALRSVERTVAEVLLPAVCALDAGLPEAAFAQRFAAGWLAAAMRVAPPASRPEGVLVFDAGAPLSADGLHAQALELALRRGGLRTLVLTAALDPERVGRAVRALQPRAVVLTGSGASLDALARLVFAARRASADADVAVLDFRGAVPAKGASLVERLPDHPLAAREALLARLAAPALRAAV